MQQVTNLEPLDGTLFVFPEEIHSGFWMKDTKIALQIGFFDCSGRLQESTVLQPCRDMDCPVYIPNKPYKYALEMPADSIVQLDDSSSVLSVAFPINYRT